MSLTFDSPEFDCALRAVREAAALCQQVRAALVAGSSATKDDRSPVTVADYGAQALVLQALHQAFPGDPAVGEEDAGDLRTEAQTELRSKIIRAVQNIHAELDEATILAEIDRGGHPGGASGRFWTLDPIDGTKGFLRNDQYAVALALIVDGKPVLGVLGCPALPLQSGLTENGCFFGAVAGQGCRAFGPRGEPLSAISVSDTQDAATARFCESVESGHSKHDWAAQVAEKLSITEPSVRMDSQCKYAAIARGDADIYLRLPTRAGYQEKIWDHAAGALCVTQAGGTVTDIYGKPLDFSQGRTLVGNEGVVASNGRFHDAVVAAVQATRA
ncbi:MAG: 3'(2'),5'-bisphosphate nucleotidase [Opitutales bacterium]